MKINNNWVLAGMLAGIVFAIGSFVRYYIVFSDYSRLLQNCLLGVLIFCIAFLYDRLIKLEGVVDNIEIHIKDVLEAKSRRSRAIRTRGTR